MRLNVGISRSIEQFILVCDMRILEVDFRHEKHIIILAHKEQEKEQAKLYRDALSLMKLYKIGVHTIDSMQGLENRYSILDLVLVRKKAWIH